MISWPTACHCSRSWWARSCSPRRCSRARASSSAQGAGQDAQLVAALQVVHVQRRQLVGRALQGLQGQRVGAAGELGHAAQQADLDDQPGQRDGPRQPAEVAGVARGRGAERAVHAAQVAGPGAGGGRWPSVAARPAAALPAGGRQAADQAREPGVGGLAGRHRPCTRAMGALPCAANTREQLAGLQVGGQVAHRGRWARAGAQAVEQQARLRIRAQQLHGHAQQRPSRPAAKRRQRARPRARRPRGTRRVSRVRRAQVAGSSPSCTQASALATASRGSRGRAGRGGRARRRPSQSPPAGRGVRSAAPAARANAGAGPRGSAAPARGARRPAAVWPGARPCSGPPACRRTTAYTKAPGAGALAHGDAGLAAVGVALRAAAHLHRALGLGRVVEVDGAEGQAQRHAALRRVSGPVGVAQGQLPAGVAQALGQHVQLTRESRPRRRAAGAGARRSAAAAPRTRCPPAAARTRRAAARGAEKPPAASAASEGRCWLNRFTAPTSESPAWARSQSHRTPGSTSRSASRMVAMCLRTLSLAAAALHRVEQGLVGHHLAAVLQQRGQDALRRQRQVQLLAAPQRGALPQRVQRGRVIARGGDGLARLADQGQHGVDELGLVELGLSAGSPRRRAPS